MDRKKLIVCLYMFCFLILASIVNAFNITSFSDGTNTGKIIFPNASSIYKNITLPYYASLNKAELDLSFIDYIHRYEYSKTGSTSANSVVCNNNDWWIYQTFLIGNVSVNETFNITNVTLAAKHSGTTPANDTLLVGIRRADRSTHALIGSDLCNATINTSIFTYTSTANWVNVTMAGNLTLYKGQYYAIVLKLIDGVDTSCLSFVQGATNPYKGGIMNQTKYGFATEDLEFETFGYNFDRVNGLLIKTNNEVTYYNGSDFNGTVTDIDLNITSLQSCVRTISSGYVNCTLNFTSAHAGVLQYKNIDVGYGDITFYLEFRDELTNDIIYNRNISLELFTGNSSYNYTTDNGNITITGLSRDFYMFRYSATDYYERFYYLNAENVSWNNLTFYLINSSEADIITATIYDNTYTILPEAYIYALKFNPINNTYFIVEMAKSNFDGVAKLHLVQNTEFYKFYLFYPFGTLREISTESYIFSTEINFVIDLYGTIGQYFRNIMGIYYDLSFNNNTNTFRFDWVDGNGLTQQACLEVYKVGVYSQQEISNTCTAATAGTITQIVTPINDTTYIAKAYVTFNPTEPIDTLSYTYVLANPLGNMGIFIVFIMTLVFAFVGFWSLSAAALLVTIPQLLGSVMRLITIPVSISIGFVILGGIIAIMLGRRG